MLALSRDAAWAARLERLAAAHGWPFERREAGGARERALVLLDKELAGRTLASAVKSLRGLHPGAAVAVVVEDGGGDAASASALVSSGADEILLKEWDDELIVRRLSVLSDRAAADARSRDGGLVLDRRAHRASVKDGNGRRELALDAADFALLWRLLASEGAAVTRDELIAAMRDAAGRELQSSSLARRVAALRRRLLPWTGKLETVRGGGFRLAS